MKPLEDLLKQLDKESDTRTRAELCRRALALVTSNENALLWAALQVELGNSLAQDPLGERVDNLERAIEHYGAALTVYTRAAFPADWAMTQHNLAATYRGRIRGERADNLERAIEHYGAALEVRSREGFPEQWAMTQNNLAIAYGDRIRGERADNLERAIEHYGAALTVYSREAFPEQWAMTQNNLANAYGDRIRGERADNLERAIEHYGAALTVYTREAFPADWAMTQNNLAAAYRGRIRGERADNLERAIEHYGAALTVYTREAFPVDWAMTQHNLANAYRDRIRGERADNLERAFEHYGAALEVRTREGFPEQWAMTQDNLASAYGDRIRGERADNLELAIEHYGAALEVRSREGFPADWAMTQDNLASAYWNRIRGERADNLERAIEHYGAALEVRSREAFPADWAMTQNNLANAYSQRIRGERADNLERAIEHYGAALTVYTREAFPADWAATQNNLAATYWDRIRGERADNLELAIEHYGAALEVRSREGFPADWAGTQNNLANAYSDRIRGERADNLELAIEHYGAALTVYTREAFPADWAMTQDNLASAYSQRIRGERADNLELAIKHYGAALTVYSRLLPRRDRQVGSAREAFPAEHRRTQRNLGALHFEQGNWEPAHLAYEAAIDTGADLLAEAYTETGRRAEVGESASLYAEDAYALLCLERPGDGLVRLEQGKSRLLAETLALADLDLTMLPEADQQAMRSARQAVRELEAEMRLPADTPARRSDRELAEALRQARADLGRRIASIRAERPEFMPTGLDLPELLGLIPEGGALVAPLFTSKGSAVFVLPHGTATVTKEHVIELDRFTTADLRALLQGADDEPELGGWRGAYANSRANWQGWLAAIETTGLDLWEGLIGAVHERLAGLGLARGASVLLMPQGGLGLLPLHAAWRTVNGQKRCLLDDWSVIYAPSGYAVSVSRERLNDTERQGQALLAVVNPTQDLAFTPAEAKAVMALFANARALKEAEATVNAVIEAAPGRQYLHFSGHGFYNWQDAMQSGLVMAEGKPLTLATIIADLDLRACRLVTLSACETGITDIRQSPDEFLGLPAGLLQAGAPAVVSTLWPVNDLSTMLLMERFYHNVFADNGKAPQRPAGALRQAQLWLRDATAGDLKLAEHWRQVYETTSDRELAKTAFRNMRYFESHLSDRPFASPYHWAGFAYAGA